MSTATGPASAYADCDEYIEHRIRAARNRIKWTDLLTALLLAGVLLIGYVLIFTLFDHWVVAGGFAPTTRAVMLGVVVLLCAVIVYRFVIRPWTKEIHPLYAAKMLDKEHGSLDGALLSLVDLNGAGAGAGADAGATSAIRRTIEKRAAVGLAEINMDEAIDRKWLMNLGVTLFVLVLTTCVYAVFSPKSMNLLRPLSLSKAAVATQTRILRIQPGNAVIQSGKELEITADIGGNMPDAVHVLYTTQDQTYVDEQLTMSATDDAGRYRVMIVGESDRGLRQNFTYKVIAGDATSEEFQVTVDEPPSANVTRLSYAFPAYMDLPDTTTQNGNIDAWEGTFVSIEAESNVPLRLAILKFSDDSAFSSPAEEIVLSTAGTKLTGRFQLNLRDDGTTPRYYKIDVTDTDGRVDPQPTVYSVKVRPDRIPLVQLIDPLRDMRVPSNAIIPLLIAAEDPDFLLRSVKLEYDINGESRTPMLLFDATREAPTKSWTGTWEFELQGLQLKEGDTISYHITARDNKPPLGSQARTGMLKLFIESPASDEQVQQQLQQDRALQEQQMREQNSSNGNPNPESGPSDQPNQGQQAPGEDGQPMPSEQSESNAAENAENGAKGGPASDSPQGESASETGASNSSGQQQPNANGEAGESGSADRSEAGSDGESKPDNQSSKKNDQISDDEALQQLLDSYKQKPSDSQPSQESGNQSEMNGPEGTDGSDPAAESTDPPEPQMNDAASGDSTQKDPNSDNSTTSEPSEGGENKSDMPAGSDDANREQPTGNEDPQEPSMNGADSGKPDAPNPENTDGANPENQGAEPGMNDDNQAGEQNKQEGESGNQAGEQNKQEGESGNQAGEQNKQEGESGKQAGEQNKQQGESGNQPGEQNKQEGESGNQAGKQNKQEGESDNQAGEQNKQDGESGKQAGEQNKQDGESGKQGGEQNKQGEESGKQGGESGKQGGESGKQGGESGKQGGESGKQGGESGKQGGESGKQGGESGKQGGESGKQGGESGKQGGESGKQGDESGKQGGESGKQGGEDGKQGGESGKQGGEDGKQGGEDGKQGGEDGKQGGEPGKQGGEDGKQGGEDGKQGGEQGKQGGEQGKQGGKEGGGGAAPDGESGGKGSTHGEGSKSQPGGSGSGGRNPAGGVGNKTAGGGSTGGPEDGKGSGSGDGSSDSGSTSDDANVDDAAQAADLVLKRLKKDLDRGQVDKELLEKLGWTEDQLKSFTERMQKQLDELKDPRDDATKASQLQRRRVEELLKSLDLNSRSSGRIGTATRDREQRDTTSRQAPVPARYKDLMELYQRSLSEGAKR